MEHRGSSFAALALPNSVGAQRRYPAHNPPLPHFSALLNEIEPEAVINIQISSISAEEECNSHSPTIVLGSLSVQNQLEFPFINQDEQITGLDQSINIKDEEEGGGVIEDDPNILGIDVQQTTRSNGSNVAPYALTMVLSLLGFGFFNLKQGKHTPLHAANPFTLLVVVGSGIAYMTFSTLTWINERSDYKMLKGLYYIGCNLAFISLLLMLFTTT